MTSLLPLNLQHLANNQQCRLVPNRVTRKAPRQAPSHLGHQGKSDSLPPMWRYTRTLLAKTLATTLTLCTLSALPLCASVKGITFAQSGVALAQTPGQSGIGQTGTTQLVDYARAVLEIEPIRLKYYQQAEQLMRRGTIPQNTCLGTSKANVPPGLEGICSGYLNDSKQIIERNNLTPEQFNEITLRARTDTSLMNRIQQELVKLRRSRQP